jgi:hypothetical protein
MYALLVCICDGAGQWQLAVWRAAAARRQQGYGIDTHERYYRQRSVRPWHVSNSTIPTYIFTVRTSTFVRNKS